MERVFKGKPDIMLTDSHEDCFVRNEEAALYRLGDYQVVVRFPKGMKEEVVRPVCERTWKDHFANHHFDKRIAIL